MQSRPALALPFAVAREVPIGAIVWLLAAGAWAATLAAWASGADGLLHHHELIEHGPPLWLAVPLFLLGWQVMVAGMMIPASATAIGNFASAVRTRAHPWRTVVAFIGTYFAVSSVFGLLAFFGDFVLHGVVHAAPWLADRSWLIEAGLVGLAGGYQLLPLKRRYLDACRDPAAASHRGESGVTAGAAHALDCLGSSWALMLLMFAAGIANKWWMLALTAVMVYEVRGRHGRGLATIIGLALLGLAGSALLFNGLPAWSPG